MLAKKNLAPILAAFGWVLLTCGCTPAGPRAMLKGRELLEAGKAAAAVEQFKLATSLLSSNAQAWNYLGLAAHQAGRPAESLTAYLQAIRLDQNFVEARYNLGCLLADEGKAGPARDAFTACTVLRPKHPDAWLRRARCEMQLKDFSAAETSLKEALRQDPQNPESWNALGLAQLQRSKPRDAAQSFSATLKIQPDHRAALLNLAIVMHQYLHDRPAALKWYHQYLALTPPAADWDAVNALVQSLEPGPPTVTPASNRLALPPAATNPPALKVAEVAQSQPSAPKPIPASLVNTTKPAATPLVAAAAPPEIVKLTPGPVIHAAPVVDEPPAAKTAPNREKNSETATIKPEPSSEKRGFLSRINPFRREAKPEGRVTPLPGAGESRNDAEPAAAKVTSTNALWQLYPGYPRYAYLSPARPRAGNSRECERLMAQGRREQDTQRLTEAVNSYRSAVAADPANFDAQFALGYAAYQIRSYKLSTWAWEHALAIHPDSGDARYNFALALRALNHVPDAVVELERVVRADDKLTKAHLTLGNIYAEQLKDVPKARLHYRRLLDLEPSHPRGAEIRQWLVVNNQP